MLVGAGEEKYLLPGQPVIARHEVCGHRCVGVPYVWNVVYVVDGGCYVEDVVSSVHARV